MCRLCVRTDPFDRYISSPHRAILQVRIVSNFIKSAPPGEFNEVFNGEWGRGHSEWGRGDSGWVDGRDGARCGLSASEMA